MCNNVTRDVILSTLQSTATHQSTIHDCLEIANANGIDFYEILLNVNHIKVKTTHNNVPVMEELQQCLQFWNMGEQRKHFKALMEDKVIRTVAEEA